MKQDKFGLAYMLLLAELYFAGINLLAPEFYI